MIYNSSQLEYMMRRSWRALTRAPLFSVTVVLCLTLGLSLSAAMFTVLSQTLLAPLPFADSRSLTIIQEVRGANTPGYGVSWSDAAIWRNNSRLLSSLSLFSTDPRSEYLEHNGAVSRVSAALIDSHFLATVEVQPLLGRGFSAIEEMPSSSSGVILGYTAWKECCGADPSVLGKQIQVSGKSRTIVGVMPPDFSFPGRDKEPRIWLCLQPTAADMTATVVTPLYRALGRLAPGISPRRAQGSLTLIQRPLAKSYADETLRNARSEVSVVLLKDALLGNRRGAVLALTLAVIVVWFIGSVNATNLMLARGAQLKRESAVKAALGADRAILIAEAMLTAVILAFTSALLAAGLCIVALKLLAFTLQAQYDFLVQLTLDKMTLLGVGVLTLLSAAMLGMASGLQASSYDFDILRGAGRLDTSSRQTWLQNSLVVVQVSLSFPLLIAMVLLLQMLFTYSRTPVGFQTDNLLTATIDVPYYKYPDFSVVNHVFMTLADRLDKLPGIQGAAISSGVPFDERPFRIEVEVRDNEGRPQTIALNVRIVSPEYRRILGYSLSKGRFFDSNDTASSQPVVVVNRALAKSYWGSEDVIGKPLLDFGSGHPASIIGISDDIREGSLTQAPEPEAFLSILQFKPDDAFLNAAFGGSVHIVVRTKGGTLKSTEAEVTQVLSRESPPSSFVRVNTMNQRVADSIGDQLNSSRLMNLFAGSSLAVVLLGLYSFISYFVIHRTHEIGVRCALGADRTTIMIFVMRKAGTLLGFGMLLGLGVAIAASSILRSYLYGVKYENAKVWVVAAILQLLTGALAALIPAIRAAKIDPAESLRSN